MIKVFIPLLILQASQSMTLVLIYLCTYFPLCAILNLVLKRFLHKCWLLAIILHAIPIIIVQFLLNLTPTWWLCVIFALLMSITQTFYYVPINILFSLADKKTNVAKFEVPSNIGKIIFTLFGGLLLGSGIANSTLAVAIICLALYVSSSLPLIINYKQLKTCYIETNETIMPVDKKSYRTFNLFHILFGIYQSLLDVVLPIFLYTENLTFQSITIVIVLIEIFKIGATILANFLTRKNLALWSVFTSLVAIFVSCTIIIFVRNALTLYICSCCLGVSFPLLFVPLFALFVKKTKQDNNVLNGMSCRDIYIFGFKNTLFLPYLIFPNFIVQFVLGIAISIALGFTTTKIIKTDNAAHEAQNKESHLSKPNE